ncbi:hypothetical protein [Aporhodopirellula aestuarii]|uniref:Transmembrane protein n=1 Tax=Aporhodopirellula aestuarii TaxID=2950107 RepID=A0ABT0TYW4_9BACT|nr:hypothetical protein [Aporhodopirellula aestuarii]MCM2369428.1 hypothetical protein [Aporhodopirellula aestuarii]
MSDSPRRGFVIAPGKVVPRYLRDRQDQLAEAGTIEKSKWAVLTVLFVVTGAFGMPLLWRSDRFSRLEKCFWGVIVLAYTAALLYGMVMVIRWSVGDAVK